VIRAAFSWSAARSPDTRIRREVVGQMLEYAANGTRYWGDGTLAQLFEVRRHGGGAAECFVPRLIGATAAAQAEKRSQTSLDEKLQNTEPDVLTVAERLRFLAEEIGLPIKSTPANLRLTDSLGSSLVLFYPTYKTVEFPLDLLYRNGRQAEISQVLETLQKIVGPSKKVSTKSPNVGVREALDHWGNIAGIIRTLARIRAENTPPLPDK
jgi:hypothetical protein